MCASFYGTVYRISHDMLPITYIGSTTLPLKKRISIHNSHYKRYTQGKLKNPCSIYKYMKLHGVDSFQFHTIGVFLCQTRDDLRLYEQIYIDNIRCVNKYNARRKYTKQSYMQKYRSQPQNKERAKRHFQKWKQKNRGIFIRCHCGATIRYPYLYKHKKSENHKNATKRRLVNLLLNGYLIGATIVYTPTHPVQ